jgi:hypothetical protein
MLWKMYTSLHVRSSSDFNETWLSSTDFFKMLKYSVTQNTRPVGAELFYADGRTDRQIDVTKLIVAFLTFANAPKNDTQSIDM